MVYLWETADAAGRWCGISEFPDLSTSLNVCPIFYANSALLQLHRGPRGLQPCHSTLRRSPLLDRQRQNSHGCVSILRESWLYNLWLPVFLVPSLQLSSLLFMFMFLCLYGAILVALWQLNKSSSVYRIPHSTHARQGFTVICLRRKYIQMCMRHRPISGLFRDKEVLMSSYFTQKRSIRPLTLISNWSRWLTMAYLTPCKKAFMKHKLWEML